MAFELHFSKVHYDVRNATPKVILVDWYFMPRQLKIFKDPRASGLRFAVVISHGKEGRMHQFYETVASNLGTNLKIFFDHEEALNWLKKNR